jgi:hypothetical protein
MMSGTQDWYDKAGRNPLSEPGFTPQLMARIEQAAEKRSSEKSGQRHRFGRIAGFSGLAAVLLFGVLLWPFGEWGKGNPAGGLAAIFNRNSGAAAVQPLASPSASPSAASSASPQSYNPPLGSAEFELGGVKYYMPLPSNRDKERAFAADTTAGIVWSPPPPMVNYSKPAYTHPTEPYTLYLSPKGQPELSEATAKRIYSFPLYAGGSQTYYELDGALYPGGDYIIMISNTITLGKTGSARSTPYTLSTLNVAAAAAGEPVTPVNLLTLSNEYSVYKSYLAFDNINNDMLLVYYSDNGHEGYKEHARLYNLATGEMQNVSSKIQIEVQGVEQTATYEIKGKRHQAGLGLLLGEYWYTAQDTTGK